MKRRKGSDGKELTMDKMLEEYDGDCEKSVEGILKANPGFKLNK